MLSLGKRYSQRKKRKQMENSTIIKPLYQEMYFSWRLVNLLQDAMAEANFINISEDFKIKLRELSSEAIHIASNNEEAYNSKVKELYT